MIMAHFRFPGVITTVFGLILFFLPHSFSAGQDVPTTPEMESADESESAEPLKIKVSVNEVRLDVVVLGKDGNPITDLKPEDFEVSQDNRRMNVLSSVYIDSQPDAATQPVAARKGAPNLTLLPTTAPTKEAVIRTILFVVDNSTMSFENGYYAKMALRNFVEKQMQAGDLVSILRTDYGNSAMNMFQSDKREILARINALPTTMVPRPDDHPASRTYFTHIQSRAHENQIATISHSLRVMKDMPRRKLLFMATPLVMHSDPIVFLDYRSKYIALADEALRAGVVVNLLDIDGLYNLKSMRADAEISLGQPRNMGMPTVNQIAKELQTVKFEFIPEPNPMPAQTGGVTIQNSNFFLNGIGKEAESLMRGYYLISYEPSADTFKTKDAYRRLKVKVNRKGATVYTREGFFSNLESSLAANTPRQHPLIEAILSPFQSTDLNINIAAGYVKDAKSGYLVRSWIHLDPKDVEIVETEDGGARIDLETLCVTSDIKGGIQDSKRTEFTLTIKPGNKDENLAWIQRHGIRFSMLLPVKKPGAYYVQTSIQDAKTGKIGSAYQFLEIPDLGKKEAALSNIFMITSTDDYDWIRSDAKEKIDEGVFLPVFQGEVRSPALRTYMPGDSFHTLATLYNVDPKEISRSEIEVQTVLYRDEEEFQSGNPVLITPNDVEGPDNSVQLLRKFTLNVDAPPGEYALQMLVANNKKNQKDEVITSQILSFTVTKE